MGGGGLLVGGGGEWKLYTGAGFLSPCLPVSTVNGHRNVLASVPLECRPWWEGYLQVILGLVEPQQTRRFSQTSRIKCLRKRLPRHFSFWTVREIWYLAVWYSESRNYAFIAEFFVILNFNTFSQTLLNNNKFHFQTIVNWERIELLLIMQCQYSLYDDSNSHDASSKQSNLTGTETCFLKKNFTTINKTLMLQYKLINFNADPELFSAATDIDNLVKLVRSANFKLLLDLNLQERYGIQWDPTNTAELLGYITRNNYQDVLNFELGNGNQLFHW